MRRDGEGRKIRGGKTRADGREGTAVERAPAWTDGVGTGGTGDPLIPAEPLPAFPDVPLAFKRVH
eukprot:9477160-Pyramimonas_sp.AAC.1